MNPDETPDYQNDLTPPSVRAEGGTQAGVPTVGALPGVERYFDRYRVEGELGRGGMGVVLLARDEELNKQVALKLLPLEVACDMEAIASLKKEVLRGMVLLHPGIVRVYNFERDAKGVAIVMEYVPGETLTDRRRREPGDCFDCDDILPWIEELCGVLDYAHMQAQIAHRDLKPRNIIVTPDGHVKVADFGLAAGLCGSLSRTSLNGDASGTPPYMSPQQVRGEVPTHFDDIYALGATIYELLTGKPPFYRGNVLAQVLQATPASMEQRRAERGITGKAPIPAAWEHAIAACLAKEPAGRPPSAKAFSEWLRDANAVLRTEPAVRIVRSPARVPEPVVVMPASKAVRPVPIPPSAVASVSRKSSEPLVTAWKQRQRRSASANSTILPLLKQGALVLVAAALAAGGGHAVRHRISSAVPSDSPPAEAATPLPPKPASSILGRSGLEPAQAIKPSGLERAGSAPRNGH